MGDLHWTRGGAPGSLRQEERAGAGQVNSPIERRRGYTHRPGLTRRVVLALGAGGAAAVASASVPYRVLAASPAGQLTWGSTPYAYGSYPDIDALFPQQAA